MPESVQAALTEASARLRAAGIADPARDARLLVAAALEVAPDRVSLALQDILTGPVRERLDRFLAERQRFRPMAQILGQRMFWGREFCVTSDVLDPRPETETLIEAALAGAPPRRVLDLGTGSGAIIVTLLAEWPGTAGLATDVSSAALMVAAANAAAHDVADRVEFRPVDWLDGLTGCWDLIVSNPPYISKAEFAGLAPDVRDWEPALALSPGPSGLESYQRIAPRLAAVLAPGGRALLEIGADQGTTVREIFCAAGFESVAIRSDLDGRDRVIEIVTT
jgi:release factor glutamine methyltransferase